MAIRGFGRSVAAGLILALAAGAWLAPTGAGANPYFAQKTGRACKSCHMPGMETAGLHGLNDTGHAFDREFREDPVKALEKYSHNLPAPGPGPATGGGATCSVNFDCRGDFATCYYRLFHGDKSTNTFTVASGEHRRWTVYLDAEYCISHTEVPSMNCDRSGARKYCE